MIPVQFPLAAALGPEWLWCSRPEHDSIVLLHRTSGVWTEITLEAAVLPESAAIGPALTAHAASGARGQFHVETTKIPAGIFARALVVVS